MALLLFTVVVCLDGVAVSPILTTQAQSPENPVEALFRVEVQAMRTGWTDALHRDAGRYTLMLSDIEGAAAHYEAVIDPDAPLLQQLMQLYLQLENWSAAIDTGERLLALTPEDRWAAYQIGLLLAVADTTRAAPYLRAAGLDVRYAPVVTDILAIPTDDARYGLRVGTVLITHELWPYAELAFMQYLAQSEDRAEALAYIGFVREQQSKDGGVWIEAALAQGAETPQVQYVVGLHWRGRGQYDESLAAVMKAAALDPNNPAYYAELGTAYRLLFNYEQAEHWLRTAVAVSNNDAYFQERLAIFYAEEGYRLPETSLASVQQSAGALPADPALIAGLAWGLYTMGDSDGAVARLDEALALSPEDPAARYYKAQILAEQGDLAAAIQLIRPVAQSNTIYAEDANGLLQAWLLVPEATAAP